jgi:putative membrane protein
MAYQWLKIIHVVAVISWMAGLLYLPRLFVYHAGVKVGSEASEIFKTMERRLLKAIMTPAMVVTWLAGGGMAMLSGMIFDGWFHAKFIAVLLLSAAHGLMAVKVKRFATDTNINSSTYFRILNEIPTGLMVIIVILVILKPF